MMTTPRRSIHLGPGELALAFRGERLETLLGSCVAIVLTDPRRTVGVMAHVVHARPAPPDQADSCAYGNVALQTLVDLLQVHGIAASHCDAYLCGGAQLLGAGADGRSVGDENARWARAAIGRLGARLQACDLGGHRGRTLCWTVGDAPPCWKAIAA